MEPNKVKPFLLKNMTIYSETNIIDNGYVVIIDGKIQEVGSLSKLVEEVNYEVMELPAGSILIPGFIDVHIHGVNGADTMDATPEALMRMAEALPREGTTSFLATTITQEREAIERALVNAGVYISSQPLTGKAEVLGVHLEGPFINKKMAGAQPVNHIISPETALFQEWQALSKNNIKLVTLAPEVPGALELISYLNSTGVIASLGHTDATYNEVKSAITKGAKQVTHLFNQMRGLHHREPGMVGAAFLYDELKAELIVDGVHVTPEIVNIAYRQKGSKGLLLITDSMRAKCLKNGSYDLGGQQVKVEDGRAVLEDGTLAGSILKLGQAVKNMMNYTGCSLAETIEMAAVNPAKQLNVYEHKGSIKRGKDADLVILDQNYNVFMTFCRGEMAYQREKAEFKED
ncbi:N-acetylglucosamine-6-phosphate deacetylase [Mesobacillus persicus]|uniref:N-acetylglucosamine-6-phosphate deacetylase n=1 Tax=Mesobacillus persicus TaxID=930146 RepID=A0A1H7YZQ5_9BACI|nr:N-acetylglucosamine-6-phosphate deacetylase [Mesobacillus persicus]SEM51214.1 N-acetylglucosamine-6-phosphate deacetylase [Mesobacillus persicus]